MSNPYAIQGTPAISNLSQTPQKPTIVQNVPSNFIQNATNVANQQASQINAPTQTISNGLRGLGLGAIPDTIAALTRPSQQIKNMGFNQTPFANQTQLQNLNGTQALKDVAGLASWAVMPGGEALLGKGFLSRLGTGALTGALGAYSQPNSTAGSDVASGVLGAGINAILPGVGNFIKGAPTKNAVNHLSPYLGQGIEDIAKTDPEYVINLAKKMTNDPTENIDMLTNEFKGNGGVGATVTNMRKSNVVIGNEIDDFYNQTSKDMFDQHVSDANIANFLNSKTAAKNSISLGQPVASSITDLDRIQGEGIRSLEYDDTKDRADAIIRKNVGDKINNPVYQKYSKMYSLVRKSLNKLENIRGDSDKLEKLAKAHRDSAGHLGAPVDMGIALMTMLGKLSAPQAAVGEGLKYVFNNRENLGNKAVGMAASPVMQGLGKMMSPAFNNPLLRMLSVGAGGKFSNSVFGNGQ